MRYEPGQVWTYHHRPGEDGSRLVVIRVEDDPNAGTIVHLVVDFVRIEVPQGVLEKIGHIPISAEAMDRSVVALEETLDEPPPAGGYDVWRESFDQGRAGVFTIPVAEVIDHIQQAMSAPPGPSS